MTDRERLLDLQSRWAAVGVETVVPVTDAGDFPYAVYLHCPEQLTTWVMSRERWQIDTMSPEALRVFVQWIEEGDGE